LLWLLEGTFLALLRNDAALSSAAEADVQLVALYAESVWPIVLALIDSQPAELLGAHPDAPKVSDQMLESLTSFATQAPRGTTWSTAAFPRAGDVCAAPLASAAEQLEVGPPPLPGYSCADDSDFICIFVHGALSPMSIMSQLLSRTRENVASTGVLARVLVAGSALPDGHVLRGLLLPMLLFFHTALYDKAAIGAENDDNQSTLTDSVVGAQALAAQLARARQPCVLALLPGLVGEMTASPARRQSAHSRRAARSGPRARCCRFSTSSPPPPPWTTPSLTLAVSANSIRRALLVTRGSLASSTVYRQAESAIIPPAVCYSWRNPTSYFKSGLM